MSDRGSRADIPPSVECWTPGRWRWGNSGRIQWTQRTPATRHSCPGTLPNTAHHAKHCLHNAQLQIISGWSCSHKWPASQSNLISALEHANVEKMTSEMLLNYRSIASTSPMIQETEDWPSSNWLTGHHCNTYHPEHTASSQSRRIYWYQWWCCSWWSGCSCTARAFQSPERWREGSLEVCPCEGV